MKSNYIYIADNTDMFESELPVFEEVNELPPVPVEEVQTPPKEMDVFVNKTFTSFSALLICIVIFLIFIFFFKKHRDAQLNKEVYQTEPEPTPINKEENSQYEFKKRNTRRSSNLNTPSSIHKCIKAFLENTKEN